MTDAEQLEADNAEAQRRYPAEWDRINALTGKKKSSGRRRLRNMAKVQNILDAQPDTAACGTCEHKGHRFGIGNFCELDSDSGGYVKVNPLDVCYRWKAKAA